MPTAAPLPRASMTRDDLIRMGQGGAASPWDFLPLSAQALRQIPNDIGLRLITAANAVRLGLRTLAADHLSFIPDAVLNSPEVSGLVRVVRDMPDDQVPTAHRIATARANLLAWNRGHAVVESDLSAWCERAAETMFCRAADGNIISRPSTGGADDWRSLSDQKRSLARLVRQHFAPGCPDHPRPVYIEGIDPPWLLILLAEARPREGTGYLPPVTIVQADVHQFLDGLSLADLRTILAAGNVSAFIGPDATRQLAAWLVSRLLFQISGPGLSTVATRTRAEPKMVDVLAHANQLQQARLAELLRSTSTAYSARTTASWKARFERALAGGCGGGEPLRVLIPTTRYSTFVQHASRDLARALEAAGHRADVLIEPDDSTKFTSLTYLDSCERFRPDLVVTINYPRATLADAIPAHIPYVCWIQDAMPHLFSPAIGAGQGPLDFTAGHLFDELFDRHGYPRSRAMPAPIVADESKFFTDPAIGTTSSGRAASPISPRLVCDIAYASHQSETPEAQHARLAAEFAKLNIGTTLDRLRPRLEREATKPLSELALADIPAMVTDVLREEIGKPPEPSLVDIVVRSYCQPVIDRLIRHQTLAWAADIAERRGWTLRLYGKGWEKHPRLAKYASGPLDHGDDLRQSYANAGVHLHMMAHALVHQRLIECILSGGFPLCRLHAPERWAITECLCRLGVRQGAVPIEGLDHPDILKPCRVPSWADAPALMQLAGGMQRLGLFESTFLPIGGARPGPMIHEREWRAPEQLREHDPELWSAFLLLGQNEHFLFHSPESLESRLDTVLARRDLREAWSAAARRRFTDRFTYSGFARRLLGFIRDQLGTEAAP